MGGRRNEVAPPPSLRNSQNPRGWKALSLPVSAPPKLQLDVVTIHDFNCYTYSADCIMQLNKCFTLYCTFIFVSRLYFVSPLLYPPKNRRTPRVRARQEDPQARQAPRRVAAPIGALPGRRVRNPREDRGCESTDGHGEAVKKKIIIKINVMRHGSSRPPRVLAGGGAMGSNLEVERGELFFYRRFVPPMLFCSFFACSCFVARC